jgi:hypothetical protein
MFLSAAAGFLAAPSLPSSLPSCLRRGRFHLHPPSWLTVGDFFFFPFYSSAVSCFPSLSVPPFLIRLVGTARRMAVAEMTTDALPPFLFVRNNVIATV